MRPASIIAAALVSSLACGPAAVPPPVPPASAPRSAPSAAPASIPEAITGEPLESTVDPGAFHVVPVDRATIDWETFIHPMNARTPDGRVIYRGENGCFVLVLDDERDTAPAAVSCPETMRTAHWAHCPGGTLVADEGWGRCLCHLDGTPPPPPHLQDCPPAPPPLGPTDEE